MSIPFQELGDGREFIPTRRSLLSRLKHLSDEESWRVFFETYWKLIYRAAIRAGLTHAEAEDVVQETVISISKRMQSFKYDPAKGSFKTYLLNMTHWRILAQLRKRLPVREPMAQTGTDTATNGVDRFASPVPSALESLWDKEWEENLVEAALRRVKEKVDPKFYQVFDCHVYKKWPAAKVAKDLRVTRGRVYLAKHLISKLVQKEIERLRIERI